MNLLIFWFLALGVGTQSWALFSPISYLKPALKVTDTTVASNYEKQLQVIEKDLRDVGTQLETIKEELVQVVSDKKVLTAKLEQTRSRNERQMLQRQVSLENQNYQILTDAEQVYTQVKTDLEQRLNKLNEYYADTEFKRYRVQGKSITFDEVQELGRLTANTRQFILDFEKRKPSLLDDITKRKKTLEAIVIEIQDKVDQKEASQLGYKKELAEGKLKEAESRLALNETEYDIARKQLVVLRQEHTRVKRMLIVDAPYVKRMTDALDKKRQVSLDKQDQLHEKIKGINLQKDTIEQNLQDLRVKHNVAPNELISLREWSKVPKTTHDWELISQAGKLLMQDAFLDTEREYWDAQIGQEKVRLQQEENAVMIVKSWHKMTQNKFRTGSHEAIEQDMRAYSTLKAELQADLAGLTEKRNAAINVLHSLNLSLDRIKGLIVSLKAQYSLLFKDSQGLYNKTLKELVAAEDYVRQRLDVTAKLIENYSTSMAQISQSLKKIEDVVSELGSKGWWQQQSLQAIEWSELRNFFPDIKQFISDFFSNVAQHLSFDALKKWVAGIKGVLFHPQELLHLLLQLAICIVLYYLFKLYIPDFRRHLLMVSPEYGAFATLCHLMALILGFIYEWFFGLYIWASLFIAIKFEIINDSFLAMFFYVGSMFYLLYVVHTFMHYFVQINKQRGYSFVSQAYQKRFMLVVFPLMIATIILFFLREAFMQGHYPASQVPVILVAINFILFQIALLCLIGKEQIVSLIPTRTPLWEWVVDHVNKYYYVILAGVIAVIIMSNPYVGYGRQVLYVLSRLLLTAILIPLFSWLHNRIKQNSSDLFFYYTDGEAVKERFSSAKTWYGFFVIFTFFAFVIIGVLLGAALWGKTIGLRELSNWLNYEIYSPGINEITGKKIEITALSLLQIVGFIAGGIVLTYIINYFLLRRIFDPLLVGVGVQNTILTLSRYIIIIIAALIGLQSAGLDTLATKLAVIIGIIGFAIKEPIGDFFSYFIILVQRPIGIGDLIMLDNDSNTLGVVRQITPRSTIVRRRNSVTLIVPNSHIINKPVTNWNYTRNFFAFEDIFVTVPYASDPQRVKQIIFRVLDTNPNILKNPASVIWLHDFVDHGYQFLIRGYLTADKTLNQWEIASEIRLEIVRSLRAEGISIASPTRLIRIEAPSDNQARD